MVRAGQQIETQNVAVIVIAHSIGRRQITVVDQGNVPVIIGRPFFGAIPYRISLDRSDGTFLGYVLVIELSFEIGPEGIAVFVRRIHDDRVPVAVAAHVDRTRLQKNHRQIGFQIVISRPSDRTGLVVFRNDVLPCRNSLLESDARIGVDRHETEMFRKTFVIEIDRPGRISLFLRVAADAGIHISRRRLFRSGTRKRNSQVTAEFRSPNRPATDRHKP